MSERTAQSHTRKVRPRKVAVSKVTNARDALAAIGDVSATGFVSVVSA